MGEEGKAYCARCKERVEIVKPRRVQSKNGRQFFMRGRCPKCSGMVWKAVNDG